MRKVLLSILILLSLFLEISGIILLVSAQPFLYERAMRSNFPEIYGGPSGKEEDPCTATLREAREQWELSEEEIRDNYHFLIRYLFALQEPPFQLHGLPASVTGVAHFHEVRLIYQRLLWAFLLSLLACLALRPGLRRALQPAEKKALRHSLNLARCILFLLLPLALGSLMALNFSAAFTAFHQLFFANDWWLFDPATDPVILYLPESFFASMAVAMLALLLLDGVIAGVRLRGGAGRPGQPQRTPGRRSKRAPLRHR